LTVAVAISQSYARPAPNKPIRIGAFDRLHLFDRKTGLLWLFGRALDAIDRFQNFMDRRIILPIGKAVENLVPGLGIDLRRGPVQRRR
jgi:hypothetical protein